MNDMPSEGDLSADATALARERTRLALERTAIAAKRTLMAWVRTSISMIGFGFSIYKFLQYLPGGSKAVRMLSPPSAAQLRACAGGAGHPDANRGNCRPPALLEAGRYRRTRHRVAARGHSGDSGRLDRRAHFCGHTASNRTVLREVGSQHVGTNTRNHFTSMPNT